jgi:hypothetical protein
VNFGQKSREIRQNPQSPGVIGHNMATSGNERKEQRFQGQKELE